MFDKTKFLFRKQDLGQMSFFQNDANLIDEKIEYEWTKDPFLVKQYMKMIDKNYDDELQVADTYKKIGLSDLRSNFLVAKVGGKVIMGVRLTLNDPYLKYSLPTEKNNFSFGDLFTEIDFVNNRYSEATKYSVLDEHRNDLNHYVQNFRYFKQLLDQYKVKYLVMCGSKSRQRMYKKFATKNFKFIDMKKLDISLWPEYSTISFAQDSWASLYENQDV